jgi:hypothetical protein
MPRKNFKIKNMEDFVKKLIIDTQNISFKKDDNYLKTYPYFIKYFDEIEGDIQNEHFVIGSHFVYGWMPTILKKINYEGIVDVVKILNKSKNNIEYLNEGELEVLKNSINNSIVGASKLLHFISPGKYPIYDSRIFRYIKKAKIIPKFKIEVNNVDNYLMYLDIMKELINNEDIKTKVISIIKNNEVFRNNKISDLRALELLMFETDKKTNSKETETE